tara:strand:- start:387 stop:617 length:231 start_codon:yes stop_codon:yes gene_type:complete
MGLLCKNKKFRKFLVFSLLLFSLSVLYACFCKSDMTTSTLNDNDKNSCVSKVKKQQKLIIGHLNRIEYKLNQQSRR